MSASPCLVQTISRHAVAGLVSVALALAVVGAAPLAFAEPPRGAAQPGAVKVVNADVMIMHATQIDGGAFIDPLIGKMPELSQPPLSAYNSYRLLDRKNLLLEAGKSANYPLVNNHVLQVTYVEQTPDNRFHISVAINHPGGKTFQKLLEVQKAAANQTFFVAGQQYKGGGLILAITMRP